MIAGGKPGSGTMTITQRGQRTLTLDEFLALPEEEPALEYADGVITKKMAPSWDHGALQSLVVTQINGRVYAQKLAFAFTELRTTVRPAKVSRVPDISVYLWERIERDRAARLRGAFTTPDIAIEIASPGQGRRMLMDRCRWFVAHGSQAALPIDPRRQDLTEVRPGGVERRLRGADVLDFGDVVPGLTIPVGDLFAALTFE
jgi:Uma2 family endonuclease